MVLFRPLHGHGDLEVDGVAWDNDGHDILDGRGLDT